MLAAALLILPGLLPLAIGGLTVIPGAAALAPPLRAPIKHVETSDQVVALTFDACATRTKGYGFDRPVFDTLKREGVPATIFVSGRWVESHPDVMAELVADPLIEFGDHSYDHPHMSRMPADLMAAEVDQTEAALARYGKKSVAFRPPFGEWNQRVLHVVQDKQLPMVLWDVVSGDPSARTTTTGMIRTVLRKARPGSIIVFHINGRGWKTAEALPVIVRELRARGLKLVHLSQLLTMPGPVLVSQPPAPAGPEELGLAPPSGLVPPPALAPPAALAPQFHLSAPPALPAGGSKSD
jgi:peptidoglycan/xylan/chitin deacetylase (PgdA/CDA1 family)